MPATRSRLAAATVVISATVAVTTLAASPAFAFPSSHAFCPPTTASAGVAYYDQDVYDSHDGPYDAAMVDGAFPGVNIVPGRGLAAEFQGAPTKLGLNTFTVELRHDGWDSSHTTCQVTVVDDVALPESITVSRIQAADRYAESVEISKKVASGTTPLVYLASGEAFADALGASAIAAQRSAPLLLTTADHLPPVVLQELLRLKPSNIVVLGGDRTILQTVLDDLAAKTTATVTRIDGDDRFEVSRNLIADPTFGAMPARHVFVASGRVFPDALSAAPAAALGNVPVLLVDGQETSLTADEQALFTKRSISTATMLGGVNTITTGLQDDLDWKLGANTVSRVAGADRYFVSSAVANTQFHLSAPSTSVDTVYLATGATFPDALAGAVIAAQSDSPIILTTKDCIPADAAKRITELGAKNIVILGGSASVGTAVNALTVCRVG